MMCWQVLGITPTVEKAAIKRAYARLLRQHNPEEDPEGFQKLRAAYELALTESDLIKAADPAVVPGSAPERASPGDNADDARRGSTGVRPDPAAATGDPQTVAGELMRQVTEIYCHFPSRIDPRVWQRLFSSDDLWRIEVKQYLAVWLFQFVAKYRHLPQAVYALLDEQLYWQANHRQLEKLLGAEVTDQVFQRMASAGWRLSYDGIRFVEGIPIEQCEHYLDGREYLNYLMQHDQHDKIDKLLADLAPPDTFDPELLRLMLLRAERSGDVEKALEICQALCEGLPTSIDGWLSKARLLYQAQQFAAAMTAYQAVLALDEEQVIAVRGLAACYFELGDLHAAKVVFEQAREQEPFDIEARIQLRRINEKLIEQGLAELEKSRVRNKGQWRRQVAEAYLDLGRYQACIDFLDGCDSRTEQYQEAAKIVALALLNREQESPFHCLSYDFHVLRGKACEGAEQWERAQFDYENALLAADKSEGNGFEALLRLGKLALRRGHYEQALEHLESARAYSPDNHQLIYEIADALRMQERFEQSLIEIDRAIALDGDRWIYHSVRSLVLMALERYEQALADLDMVIAHSIYFAWGWYRKGYCLSQLGRYREAIPIFQQATEYMANFHLAYEQLCEAACRAGDAATAQQALCDFIDSGGAAETAARLRDLYADTPFGSETPVEVAGA